MKVKWTTIVKYVDHETAEIIKPDQDTIILQTKKFSYVKEGKGITEITKLCKKAEYKQQTISF